MATLRTKRLILRPWREADLAPFAALNADPEVMAHFPKVLDRAESDGLAGRIGEQFATHGFGLWALEVPDSVPFAGYIGLMMVPDAMPFAPAVEVGWRLARAHWGKGYATEAARAAVAYGFDTLGLVEVVSFTVPANARSIAVMARLGMTRAADFDHPKLPVGHPLRLHVLYRLRSMGVPMVGVGIVGVDMA